jgi:hypothetical protein
MSRSFSYLLPILATLPLMVLTGCGASTSFSHPQSNTRVFGRVIGGQQPVAYSLVRVYAAGTTGYGSNTSPYLAYTLSLADGSFSFPDDAYTCTPGEQVYIIAQGGQPTLGISNANIALAVGLGDCTTAQTSTVEINEVTTAATAFALAQFFTPTLGIGSPNSFGTDPADLFNFSQSNQSTIPMLVDISSGTVNPNTPNLTIEAAKLNSIANTLAACVNDSSATPIDPTTFANCNTLFANTTPPGGTTPTNTLQAAVQMARFPYQNVPALYDLASSTAPFVGLTKAPTDWTLAVSYTSTNYALSIAGTPTSSTSSTIDIDGAGRVWFPSTLSGHTGLAYFDPATATFNGPYITGVFTQPQYVAINNGGIVYISDVASPNFGAANAAFPATAFETAPVYEANVLGPLAGDGNGNMLFSYIDASTGAPYFAGFIGNDLEYSGIAFTYPPTGLTALNPNSVFATTSGSSTPCAAETLRTPSGGGALFDQVDIATTGHCTSGGAAYAFQAFDELSATSSVNGFCSAASSLCQSSTQAFNLPQGIATDGHGNEWVANSGNGSVFTFGSLIASTPYQQTTPAPYLHDAANGNTMSRPYAIAIDGSGNVWLANAGCVTTSATPCVPGPFVLSELIGAAGPTITPLSLQMTNGGELIGNLPGTTFNTQNTPHPAGSSHSGRTATPLLWRH